MLQWTDEHLLANFSWRIISYRTPSSIEISTPYESVPHYMVPGEARPIFAKQRWRKRHPVGESGPGSHLNSCMVYFMEQMGVAKGKMPQEPWIAGKTKSLPTEKGINAHWRCTIYTTSLGISARNMGNGDSICFTPSAWLLYDCFSGSSTMKHRYPCWQSLANGGRPIHKQGSLWGLFDRGLWSFADHIPSLHLVHQRGSPGLFGRYSKLVDADYRVTYS